MRGAVAVQAMALGSPGTRRRLGAEPDADVEGATGAELAESIGRAAGGVRQDAKPAERHTASNLGAIFENILMGGGPLGSHIPCRNSNGFVQKLSQLPARKTDVTPAVPLESRAMVGPLWDGLHAELFRSLPEAAVVFEMASRLDEAPVDFVLLDANPAFHSLMGLAAGEQKGRRLSEFSFADQHMERLASVAASREPVRYEIYEPAIDKPLRFRPFWRARDGSA